MFDRACQLLRTCLLVISMALWASPATAGPGRTVEIVIAPAGDAVEVVYTLSEPATSLTLGLASGPPPAAVIDVREAALTLQDGRITGSRPFTKATLRIGADQRERDGLYPLARPVAGSGFVLYAPYLLPDAGAARVRVRGFGRSAARVREPALNGYIVIGPAPERHRGFRFLAGHDVPAATRDAIVARSAQLLDYYRAKLGAAPEREPTIILTRHSLLPGMTRNLLRGDVSANGVVFLRTYLGDAGAGEPPTIGQYSGFLAHELFHLWNRSGDAERRNWWLAEGGAEYAGWLARRLSGRAKRGWNSVSTVRFVRA
jgi:hypothetical protein